MTQLYFLIDSQMVPKKIFPHLKRKSEFEEASTYYKQMNYSRHYICSNTVIPALYLLFSVTLFYFSLVTSNIKGSNLQQIEILRMYFASILTNFQKRISVPKLSWMTTIRFSVISLGQQVVFWKTVILIVESNHLKMLDDLKVLL